MTEERLRFVLGRVLPYIRKNALSIPVDVRGLCAAEKGVHPAALSEISAILPDCPVPGEIRDGITLYVDGGKTKLIVYNDKMPEVRIRFTLAHELMHIVLGHTEHEGEPTEEEYRMMEEESNFAAGILLCPPKLYYSLSRKISSAELAKVCFVSNACAARAMISLENNRALICETADYSFMKLPDMSPASRNLLMAAEAPWGYEP